MTLLDVRQLVKTYGGLTATDHLDLTVNAHELHAVIGPNGAGKSTLIHQLCGEVTPDSGHILFNGRNITRSSVSERALLGIARSYQITSVFNEFSALHNVMLAVQAHQGHSFRFWSAAGQDASLIKPAQHCLERVGLAHRAQVPAAFLAHGEQRQLELAMVLAGQPRLLLLDEPMAGMSQAESARMTELLQALKKDYAIVLVEHDMDAVFALADRMTVLVYGRALAVGSVDQIRANTEVQSAYLGDTA